MRRPISRARAAWRLGARRILAMWDEAPRTRKTVPWAAAILLNVAILAIVFVYWVPVAPERDEERIIPIDIVRPEPPAPLPEPEPEPEPEVAEEETLPSEAPPIPSIARTPEVELPETEAKSKISGVVGLDCAAVFDDPAEIESCAGGAEIAGWRGEVLRLGEDWSRIAREMGRASGPYAPSPRMAATPERMREFDAQMARKRAMERYRDSSPMTSRGADQGGTGGATDYNRPVLLSDDDEDGSR